MYILIAAFFSVLVGLLSPQVSEAYIWRCQTPNGYIWTEQPSPNSDCQEFDGTYNPSAAPPQGYSQPSQPAPQPQAPPPMAMEPSPYVYPPYAYAPYAYAPYPYPYYGYPYPPYYYARPGVYLGVPFFGFNFRFGGHGGHFRH